MINQAVVCDVMMFHAAIRAAEPWVNEAILSDATEFRASAGVIVLHKDEKGIGLPLLTQGCLKITRSPVGNGRSVVLYRVMPGDLCIQSAVSVLSNSASSIDAHAESNVAGIIIPPPLLRRLVTDSETFRSFVFSRMAEQFSRMVELIDDLAFGRLETRLARRLMQEPAAVRMTHQKLADELGSAREVISRLLKDFENRGAIRRRRGQIQVANPVALQSFAAIPAQCDLS